MNKHFDAFEWADMENDEKLFNSLLSKDISGGINPFYPPKIELKGGVKYE